VPWGRIEDGESPAAAAIRETYEEGGVRARIEGLLGIQELPSPQDGWIAIAYLCRHVSGDPAPLDAETDAARYYSVAALDRLSEPIEPWSDWLVRRVLAGRVTVIHPDRANPLWREGTLL
jgi:phosphatase NudJ